jgi:hypothetical protein
MVAVQLAGSPSSVVVQPLDADGRPATEHGVAISGCGGGGGGIERGRLAGRHQLPASSAPPAR